MSPNMYIHINVCMNITYKHVFKQKHTYKHMLMYVYACFNMHKGACVYTHAYIHMTTFMYT